MPEATHPPEGAAPHFAKPDPPEGLLAAPPEQRLLKPLDGQESRHRVKYLMRVARS